MILLNSGCDRVQKLGGFSRYVPIGVPIGIGYLAAYLIKHGKTVKILDGEVNDVTGDVLDRYVKDLSQPYIFGISSLTAGIAKAHRMADLIKRRYPGSKIIFGNMHPTVMTEDVLKDRNIDVVVRGEGEEVLDLLYERMKAKKDHGDIKGISFCKDGRIIHNEAAPLPDLATVPRFPYHLFAEHSGKYDLGFITSSRGCPYNCIFCSQRNISGKRYRYFPPEIVIQDLEELILKHNRSFITFADDSFLTNRERVVKLCDAIKERGFHKKAIFDCQARGDTVDEGILKTLRDTGFRTIHFGIETASERLMKLIDKRETVQEIVDAVKLSKRLGFQVSGTFILGLPTETREERRAAYALAKELSLDYVRFNNATPYPGTRLYEIAKEEGRLTPGKEWENLNACGTLVESPFKTSSLAYVPLTATRGELNNDILKFNLFYSFRLQSVLKILKERIGPAGWLALPERWYLKPGEWSYLIRFGLRILFSFAKVFSYDALAFLRRKKGLVK
ncbi:MAG: radical SAM protein [Candidatus Omnitrophica bacterium]|nr:radical SAM protein [Candidatus Omnitrophota bacterium]